VRFDWLLQLGASSSHAAAAGTQAECQGGLGAFHDLPLSIFLAEAEASAAWAHKGDQEQAAGEWGAGGCKEGGVKGVSKRAAMGAPAGNSRPVQKRDQEAEGW